MSTCCLEFTVDTCDIVFELSCSGPPGPPGPSGAATFTDLTDTPSTYAGNAGKLVKVDPLAQELIFGDPSGTTVSWGDILGTLADQTDLQAALDAKAAQVDLVAHTSDLANPHATTAAQVGADPVGSAATVQSDLNTHKADLANPHSTTAAQVGADPTGSAAAVQLNLDDHVGDLANPHATTAVQVGADPAGSAAAVQGNLDTHVGDLANPHAVTAAQAGAEPDLGNPTTDGFILSSTALGVRSWVAPGSGGASVFTGLLDTPANYTGEQGKLVKVNATEDGLIFGDPSGTTVSWGDIAGILSNQTDLQAALDAKIGASGVTYENLAANGDVGTGATQVAQGDHLHPGVYDPAGSAASVQGNLDTHIADNANPHNLTPASIGAVEEAPLDAKKYSRQSAGWVESPRTPIGGLYGRFVFVGDTTATDPGPGGVKVNNADLMLATELYISGTTRFGSAVDPDFLNWGPKDYLGLFDELQGNGAFYNIVGAIVDNTGWYTIPVSPQNGGDNSITPGRNSVVTEITAPDSRVPRGGTIGQYVVKTGVSDFQTGWQTLVWGGIGGTLANQTDLQAALDVKLGAVQEDTAPTLGGDLQTNGNQIFIQDGTPTEYGRILALPSDDGAVFGHASDISGAFLPATDAGFFVTDGELQLLGQVIEVPSFKSAGQTQVYASPDGVLYTVQPPAPGWLETDTDNDDYAFPTLAVWVEIIGLVITIPQDVAVGDRLDAFINLYFQELSGNRGGTIDVGFGIDGVTPTTTLSNVRLDGGFDAVVPINITTTTHGGLTTGQTLSVFVRRSSQDHSQFDPRLRGSIDPSELIVSVPGEGGSGGGIPEAPADNIPKTRRNDGATPVWQNERVVPDGGADGQIIIKNSATEQDAGWSDVPTALSATWVFDSSTVAADPGAGGFRLNAATRAATTAIYFNDLTSNGIDVGEWLGLLKDGQKVFVIQSNKPDRAALYEVNGTPTDNTGWWTVPVTHIQNGSGGELQAGRDVVFDFTGFGGGSIINWGEIIGTLSDQTDLQAALDAKEDGLGNPTVDGYVLSSTIAGVRSWVAAGAGGGIPEPADNARGYLRRGPASNDWVAGSRIFQQANDPGAEMKPGDIWFQTP